jgi:hypothetical protein
MIVDEPEDETWCLSFPVEEALEGGGWCVEQIPSREIFGG